jgi:hypothetical protein
MQADLGREIAQTRTTSAPGPILHSSIAPAAGEPLGGQTSHAVGLPQRPSQGTLHEASPRALAFDTTDTNV